MGLAESMCTTTLTISRDGLDWMASMSTVYEYGKTAVSACSCFSGLLFPGLLGVQDKRGVSGWLGALSASSATQ